MAIEWTENLVVGVEMIDAQHRELFKRFNDLLEGCAHRQGTERIGDLLAFLDEYVNFHFGAEEGLMECHCYPGMDEHKEMHAYFVRRLQALSADFRSGGASPALVAKTNKVLLNWIVDHIKKVDVRLGKFLGPRMCRRE